MPKKHWLKRIWSGLSTVRSVQWIYTYLIPKIVPLWAIVAAIGATAVLTAWGWLTDLPPLLALLVSLSLLAVLLLVVVLVLEVVLRAREWLRNRREWFRFSVSMEAPGQIYVRVTNKHPQDEVSLQVACVRGATGGGPFPIHLAWGESNQVHARIAKNDSRVAHIGKAEIRWHQEKRGDDVEEIPYTTFAFHTPTGERITSQGVAFSNDPGVAHLWELELKAVALSDGKAASCRMYVYLSDNRSIRVGFVGKATPGFDPYPFLVATGIWWPSLSPGQASLGLRSQTDLSSASRSPHPIRPRVSVDY